MACLDRIHAVSALCVDLAHNIVNVDEDGEDIEYLPDGGLLDWIVVNCPGVRTCDYCGRQKSVCLIHMFWSAFESYREENSRQAGSSRGDSHKVCDHYCYSERSIDCYVGQVACFRVSIACNCRYAFDSQHDFGVLHFPMRDLPYRD